MRMECNKDVITVYTYSNDLTCSNNANINTRLTTNFVVGTCQFIPNSTSVYNYYKATCGNNSSNALIPTYTYIVLALTTLIVMMMNL